MKVLLGTCLALALAGGIPALADGYSSGPSQQQSGSYNQDSSGSPDGAYQAGPRRHAARQFSVGDRVPPRLMSGKHVVTNFAKARVTPPHGGQQWVRTRSQFLLVGAHGVVRQVVMREHRGMNRQYRRQQQPAQYDQSGQQDQYSDQSDQSDQSGQSDQSDQYDQSDQ